MLIKVVVKSAVFLQHPTAAVDNTGLQSSVLLKSEDMFSSRVDPEADTRTDHKQKLPKGISKLITTDLEDGMWSVRQQHKASRYQCYCKANVLESTCCSLFGLNPHIRLSAAL